MIYSRRTIQSTPYDTWDVFIASLVFGSVSCASVML